MGIDFNAIAATATQLIADNGRDLTLKRNTAPGNTYDPVTGDAATPSVPVLYTIKAVVLAMTAGYAMKVGQQNISARDRLLLMGPSLPPLLEDVITFDGDDWQIINIEENAPNGTPLYYQLQVRP